MPHEVCVCVCVCVCRIGNGKGPRHEKSLMLSAANSSSATSSDRKRIQAVPIANNPRPDGQNGATGSQHAAPPAGGLAATPAGAGGSSSGVNPPALTIGSTPPFFIRLQSFIGKVVDDLQLDRRRLYSGVSPRRHLWTDIRLEHKRIAGGGSAAASTPRVAHRSTSSRLQQQAAKATRTNSWSC